MILVDTCVLLDLATEDPRWFDWSLRQITYFGSIEELAYNPVIYAEMGVKERHQGSLDRRFAGWFFDSFDTKIAWRAARAHSDYRARGGKRERVLGDFWIGAHAEVRNWYLLTRNPEDFKEFSLGRRLIHPGHGDASA
ncbi:MAG: type II toxin-antitoxin system VapC family toxin [Terrimicrobiaceae bacterium]